MDMAMTPDMGPPRRPMHPGVPGEVVYKHVQHCAHCHGGGRKESCPDYQAIERDFARNSRLNQTGG